MNTATGALVLGGQVGGEDLCEIAELADEDHPDDGATVWSPAPACRRVPLALFLLLLLGNEKEVDGTAGEQQCGHRFDPAVGEQLQQLAGRHRQGGVEERRRQWRPTRQSTWPVPAPHDQRGDHRLVRQFRHEDQSRRR